MPRKGVSMFEKEAKERARTLEERQTLGVYDNDEDLARDLGWNEGEVAGYEDGFKDGAEYVYNKCNVKITKAKEIIKDYMTIAKGSHTTLCGVPEENRTIHVLKLNEKAEQFISEVEK